MKKYGVWKDLILKARIWVRIEIILHLYMNALGKVVMGEGVYERGREGEKEEGRKGERERGGKTQAINFHYWLYSMILAATPTVAIGFGSEGK